MKIILVSVGNFQEYILDNIKNLLLFNNYDITIITNKDFFINFKEFFNNFNDFKITLVDCNKLSDNNFNINSQLDKGFRNGFWHFCSLRLFYVYSYIKQYNLTNCIHLENDVLTYVNFDDIKSNFKENKVYTTFDCDTRVIPGIIYIPNYKSFEPIINNYNFNINDMENLAKFNESVILPLPIFPIININKFNKLFVDFNMIFDAAAIGQYLGGVDPRNKSGDTRGFVNETCIIKYNTYKFEWIKINNLFIPHLVIDNNKYRICNLHIHSKKLINFMANNPIENYLITK
jgi:hypothetical protein